MKFVEYLVGGFKFIVVIVACVILPVMCMRDLSIDSMEIRERQEKEAQQLHNIKCYSGNLMLLEDISLGQVYQVGGYEWTSSIDGKRKYWNGVCVVKLLK